MPAVVFATLSCPKGWEGVVFTSVFAVGDASSTLSALISSRLTAAYSITEQHWGGLGSMLTVCAVARTAAPILALVIVPARRAWTAQQQGT
mmetsp:Transcript_31201/g.67372  ORF Transcript_31201/g.67372 Transcript_31201/m.67372 type:complete len:91 (+) Transcript_31201:408-680(+)